MTVVMFNYEVSCSNVVARVDSLKCVLQCSRIEDKLLLIPL